PPRRQDGAFDICKVVTIAASYFNQDILRNAVTRSFKLVKLGRVGGKTLVEVPRESVYQLELARILILWLADEYQLSVTTQWHVSYVTSPGSKLQHKYCDIIITSPSNSRHPMVLLELLASGTKDELKEHFERTSPSLKTKSLKFGW
ncbi:hypothetical protein BGX21_005621, partial [Mortierella sp. AD011]